MVKISGSETGAHAAHDLDGDGVSELVLDGNGNNGAIFHFDEAGRVASSWSDDQLFRPQGRPAVADLDGDGANDLVIPLQTPELAVRPLLNDGQGEFRELFVPLDAVSDGRGPFGGRDCPICDRTLYARGGSGLYRYPRFRQVPRSTGEPPREAEFIDLGLSGTFLADLPIVADIDPSTPCEEFAFAYDDAGDLKNKAFVYSPCTEQLVELVIPESLPDWDQGNQQLTVTDIDGDDLLDLLISPRTEASDCSDRRNTYVSYGVGGLQFESADGVTNTFSPLFRTDCYWNRIHGVAELNGDGIPDFAVGAGLLLSHATDDGSTPCFFVHSDALPGQIDHYSCYVPDGNGGISELDVAEPTWARVRVDDFDGDGRDDLLTNSGTQHHLYRQGAAGLVFERLPVPGPSEKIQNKDELTLADMTGDGVADLIYRPDFGEYHNVLSMLEGPEFRHPATRLIPNTARACGIRHNDVERGEVAFTASLEGGCGDGSPQVVGVTFDGHWPPISAGQSVEGDNPGLMRTTFVQDASGPRELILWLQPRRGSMAPGGPGVVKRIPVKPGPNLGTAFALDAGPGQLLPGGGPYPEAGALEALDLDGDGLDELVFISADVGVCTGDGASAVNAVALIVTRADLTCAGEECPVQLIGEGVPMTRRARGHKCYELNEPFVTVADFDGDGDEDLTLITGEAPRQVLVLENRGDGTLRVEEGIRLDPAMDAAIRWAVWLDIDGDGVHELVVGGVERDEVEPEDEIPIPMRVFHLETDADADTHSLVASASQPLQPHLAGDYATVADFNGDGLDDLMVSGEPDGVRTEDEGLRLFLTTPTQP